MPVYVYETLDGSKQYEFVQKMSESAFTCHPETGESIRKIIVPGAAVKIQGLKRGAKVNKRSPAATACGCATGTKHHHHH